MARKRITNFVRKLSRKLTTWLDLWEDNLKTDSREVESEDVDSTKLKLDRVKYQTFTDTNELSRDSKHQQRTQENHMQTSLKVEPVQLLGYGQDGLLGTKVRFVFPSAQTGCAPTQQPIQWESGALPPEMKQLRCETGHSPPSSDEIMSKWNYTSTAQTSSCRDMTLLLLTIFPRLLSLPSGFYQKVNPCSFPSPYAI